MKISLAWLSEYVDIPSDIKEFCDRLDLTGTGVEGLERKGDTFDGIVVGQVKTCIPHPNSDHMHVLSVDVGGSEKLQIVCGAANVAANIKVPVAIIGAVLPGGVTIKKSKLRGIESCGMCCSQHELGMGSDADGIWILPDEAQVGMSLADYLAISDIVLDLEITPNRPDCLSVVGLAREVAAMYRSDFTNPLEKMAAALTCDKEGIALDEDVCVSIEDPQRCPRYTARVIRGVKVGPSPDWMVKRLEALGQRSINNIVDVTNYVLLLFGQPLHAFDLDKVKGGAQRASLVVRGAHEGEKLTTLDGETRVLTNDMTVIATSHAGAIALAGVMGGRDTEVSEDSVNILLEAATFEAGRTSRTSRNLNLMSESSIRYERGVDDHDIDLRSAVAAALIVEVAGGHVSCAKKNDKGIIDEWPVVCEQRVLKFRIPRFHALMGADISREDITDILKRLGCEVFFADTSDELQVAAPTFRPDLEREIDLYEEVLRLWGMDRVVPTLPEGRGRVGVRTAQEHVLDTINHVMRASGLNETMTYSFAEPNDLARLRMSAEGLGDVVELINPLNADQSVMRQSIIPGLLRSVAYNQSRGVKNVQLYEMGVVFFGRAGHKQPKECRRLSAVLAGAMHDASWNTKPVPFDFFDAKGVVENLMRELAIPRLRFNVLSPEEALHVQPGRAAEVFSGGVSLGWVGEIHPLAADAYEVQAPIAAFELDVDRLVKLSRFARDYSDVSVFPAVSIDVAFVVDEAITHERLMQCMKSAGGKLLEDARLFDVYRDALRIGPRKKSMAYALTYRAQERTLTGKEVERVHARLVKKVCGAVDAEVRR